MEEIFIKDKKRVQRHGEVFTPPWMVQKMLDAPGIKECCEDISATILEPAAGDGNFLQAILERKLSAVTEQFQKKSLKTKSLFALASIYGIELLVDNLKVARSRMFLSYLDWYEKIFGEKLSNRSDIYKSVRFIIENNIVLGNTLTKLNPITDEPIQFYRWEKVKGHSSKVRCIPFIFAELFGEKINLNSGPLEGQMSLFDIIDDCLGIEVRSEELFISEIDIKKVYILGR